MRAFGVSRAPPAAANGSGAGGVGDIGETGKSAALELPEVSQPAATDASAAAATAATFKPRPAFAPAAADTSSPPADAAPPTADGVGTAAARAMGTLASPLGALASLGSAITSWTLEVVVSVVSSVDSAEGARSVRRHVVTLGPTRCSSADGKVVFPLPGGLRVRGDVHLSLRALGLTLRSGAAGAEELGWLCFHTGWMAGKAATAPTPPAGGSGSDAGTEGAQPLVARFGKEEVDLVHRDGRFAADWSLGVAYTTGDDSNIDAGK